MIFLSFRVSIICLSHWKILLSNHIITCFFLKSYSFFSSIVYITLFFCFASLPVLWPPFSDPCWTLFIFFLLYYLLIMFSFCSPVFSLNLFCECVLKIRWEFCFYFPYNFFSVEDIGSAKFMLEVRAVDIGILFLEFVLISSLSILASGLTGFSLFVGRIIIFLFVCKLWLLFERYFNRLVEDALDNFFYWCSCREFTGW